MRLSAQAVTANRPSRDTVKCRHPVGMLEDACCQLAAGCRIPLADRVVVARRKQALAAGQKLSRRDLATVPFEQMQLFAGCGVPNPAAPLCVACIEQRTIGRNGGGGDIRAASDKLEYDVASGHIPETGVPRVASGEDALAIMRQGEDAATACMLERRELASAGRVPDAHGVVPCAGEHAPSVR